MGDLVQRPNGLQMGVMPRHFTGWSHVPRGSVEDCTVLAALAVGVALWSRLPTADEVAAWQAPEVES